MFDNNEVYNLLASGCSPEEVAAAFSKALNAAEAQVKAEEEARLEAERKHREALSVAEEEANRRINNLAAVLRDFCDFLEEYYPDMTDDQELTDEDLRALAATLIAILDINTLKAQFDIVPKTKKPAKVEAPSADEIFADFFKNFSL